MHFIKRKLVFVLTIIASFLLFQAYTFATNIKTQDLEEVIEDIISWKKNDLNKTNNESLFGGSFLDYAGSTAADWFAFGIGRYNYSDDYHAYLSALEEHINSKYTLPQKLDRNKATEWHRIALAIGALGSTPTSFGTFENESINLIADGTYNRGLTTSLGRQGINGWIWSLISLDSKRYQIPANSYNSREDMIVEILNKQLADGGWALSGNVSDVDITAMAIQALSPYYNSESKYTYSLNNILNDDGERIVTTRTVKDAIDKAINWISSVQLDDGDFTSWGTANVESTVWAMLALISIGRNPLTDEQFITKTNKTLLDGILKYRSSDGGFTHSFIADKDNPSAHPGVSNSMASEQVLYGLIGLWRFQLGMRNLFDLRTEFSETEKTQIENLKSKINSLNDSSSQELISETLLEYYEVDFTNRVYITNYNHLRRLAIMNNLELQYDDELSSGEVNNPDEETVLLHFSETNKLDADILINKTSPNTKDFSDVVRLLYVLNNSEDFSEKQYYTIELEKLYNLLTDIQNEIDNINNLVLQELYPFEDITIHDREIIEAIVLRIEQLSNDDKEKILHQDDILKSLTQVNNLVRARKIYITLSIVGFFMAVGLFFSIRNRRIKRRQNREVPFEGIE